MLDTCKHEELHLQPSVHAYESKYERPSEEKRIAATTPSGRVPKTLATDPSRDTSDHIFPAPLVLPGDELAWDPKYPPQSLRSWIQLKERNNITDNSRTIYVVGPPTIADSVDFLRSWTLPANEADAIGEHHDKTLSMTNELVHYLQAFYHGMDVKTIHRHYSFTPWRSNSHKKTVPKVAQKDAIRLDTNTTSTKIRTRTCPDGVYERQLNLSDLLDACINSLPEDAYALLLLVEHDLYEDEDDDFCCGRAYGGSRVAVVSAARYNPCLDADQEVEREHAWPASHCTAYMNACCASSNSGAGQQKGKRSKSKLVNRGSADKRSSDEKVVPLRAAIDAHVSLPSLTASPSNNALSGLWIGRVCRTASHEVGHCLGIDHCVYYACVMQGTASISEDARQPPYLCPVDQAKLLRATGGEQRDHYKALLEFCEARKHIHLFAAYGAWLKSGMDVAEGRQDI